MADYYIQRIQNRYPIAEVGKYKRKVAILKDFIRDYIHENAALVDERHEVEQEIQIRMEERRYLLRKLCEYEPQTEMEVDAFNKALTGQPTTAATGEPKKVSRKKANAENSEKKPPKPRKPSAKSRKKIVQPIPLDSIGRPVFPIELGTLTIHSLGEVISERRDFHCEEAIYPVGYVSTRIYGSLKDPTAKCIYTCKISDNNGIPRFEIADDEDGPPITGDTADVCHMLLLQKINDALSLNVVSTKPKGHDFFGLTHPTVLNLIQCSPGSRKCANYKWNKFEVAKNGSIVHEERDTSISFTALQRSINYCHYKMAPDVLPNPNEFFNSKEGISNFLQ